MSSFPILDLVAGVLFIYFVLSIIASSAVEMVLTVLRVRAEVLGNWLTTIFDKTVKDPSGKPVVLGQAIMDHCSITALSGQGKSPSYIDAKNFVSALLEKVSFDPANPESIASTLDDFIAKVKDSTALSTELKRVILTYANEARNTYESLSIKTVSEIDLFREKLEKWFDSSMDRISGTLKTKYLRPFTLVVAIITTLAMNADSIAISKFLYNNPEARSKMADMAYSNGADSINQRMQVLARAIPDSAKLTEEQFKQAVKARMNVIKDADASLEGTIPLGWSKAEFIPKPGSNLFTLLLAKIIGLTATVLAIMMGAPFWFDVLNKVSNLRSTGAKPVKTEDKVDNR
jgi:hypothetical protein